MSTTEDPANGEVREGYAEIGDQRLHYVEAGEGPLVVLLHGFPEFWYGWRQQIQPLAAAGFRVVAPDMRGYNLSSKPDGVAAYDIGPLTADNGYLKYAVELGAEGLIAHIAIFLGIGLASLKVARYGSTQNRRLLGTVVLFTTVGVMINAATGVVFNSLVLAYLYFWFAGAVVTVAQRESAPSRVAARAPLELAPA